MFRLWNSRQRLLLLSIVLTLLSVSLKLARRLLNSHDEHDQIEHSQLFEADIDYVLDSLQYMHDLKIGHAKIAPVIESEKKVRSYWWRCSLEKPIISDQEWTQNANLFIYSATYDQRYNSLYPHNHVIQIMAISFRSISNRIKYFCNLYNLSNGQYIVVEGFVREIWQRAWDPRDYFYVPNLISCPIPKHFQSAKNLTVSLSTKPCSNGDAAVAVRNTVRSVPSESNVAVCVKGMDFLNYQPEKLVEWIEMQFLSGADTIIIYTYSVPRQMRQVLNYYQNRGNITVVPITLPGESPNHNYIRSRFIRRNRQQKRRHELIPYNDCFYRHINSHRYVLILDIDELVVPLAHNNWSAMLDELVNNDDDNRKTITEFTSFSVVNAFKFPSMTSNNSSDIPKYMNMLRNRQISAKISDEGAYGKSFVSTQSVATVFNHYALHRLHANVQSTVYINKNIALKLHYKEECPVESRKECEHLEKVKLDDDRLDRFAKQWTDRVTDTLKQLHLI